MEAETTEHDAVAALPDYPAIQKIASALWHQNNAYHGAAVMVGAGFSRSAAQTGDICKKLPLWQDLYSAMITEMKVKGSLDPLRLAEEYCAYFGKQALHDFIHREIDDAAWEPGELHKSLLELPWSEILTTNWDTLLERASKDVHQPVYGIVTKQEDLSSVKTPRIAKLHGTIGTTNNFIFTQEDYRKYPQNHAAFVNFVRQVFIENELCLIGFSGDDPNFLQWAGWVRDHLPVHARRIYLVGVLDLTAPKRKYFDSINITPIDLARLVTDCDDNDLKHQRAILMFMQALRYLKPKPAWEWVLSPTPEREGEFSTDPTDASDQLRSLVPIFRRDRESYPGWLICPPAKRRELRHQYPYYTLRRESLAAMQASDRVELLYELAWWYKLTYALIEPWLVQEFLQICDPAIACGLKKKQQLEISLLLLKNTRWHSDPASDSVRQITTAILEKNTEYWPESADEPPLHYALLARDTFDYPKLEEQVMKVSGISPTQKLRKAALLAEIGLFDEGGKLIKEAYGELLRQSRYSHNSIYILSRLAWAHWLLLGVELDHDNHLHQYKPLLCDPWHYIENMKEEFSKTIEQQQKDREIEPLFNPGYYKDSSRTIRYTTETYPLQSFEGMTGDIGIPMRWDWVNFTADMASKLAMIDAVNDEHKITLSIRAAHSESSDILKKSFSRIQMACTQQPTIDRIIQFCTSSINYLKTKRSVGTEAQQKYALDRLRVFIEILARVSARATQEQAEKIFCFAMNLGNDTIFHHFWLFEVMQDLIEHSIKSIPEKLHCDILLDALMFPLEAEIDVGMHPRRWPNPVIQKPGVRNKNTAITRRIDEIIDKIAPVSPKNCAPLLRLLPLIQTNFLTDNEQRKISIKIWGETPNYEILPKTGLFAHVLLKLPSQNPIETRKLVRDHLFNNKNNTLFKTEILEDIANAAQSNLVKELPDHKQARDYFYRFVEWRSNTTDALWHTEDLHIGKLIGKVLARSVVPALSANDLTIDNFEKLYSFHSEVDSPETIIAFPYFATKNHSLSDRVEKIIREALRNQDPPRVAYASHAILIWREQNDSPATARLTSRLISLINSGRMTALQALLWTANNMYNKGHLSPDDIVVLSESIQTVFYNANYENIFHFSPEAVNISLIRAACATLSRDILTKSQSSDPDLQHILEEARNDPLPEVRFAVTEG